MKKIRRLTIIAMALTFIFAMTCVANADTALTPTSGNGSGSNPYVVELPGYGPNFGNVNGKATGESYTIKNFTDSGRIGNIYYRFTVPYDGCVKVLKSDMTGTYSNWIDVKAGDSFGTESKEWVSVSTGSTVTAPVIIYHEHVMFSLASCTYVDNTNHRLVDFKECTACCLNPHAKVETGTKLEAHQMGYNREVVEPTCTSSGYTLSHCQKCTKEEKIDIKPALGHNFVSGVCSRCGVKNGETVDPEDGGSAEDAPEFAAVNSVKAVSNSPKKALVSWDYASALVSPDGYYVYVDGVKKGESHYSYARELEVAIPYAGEHKIVVKPYLDKDGRRWIGACTASATVKSKSIGKGSISRLTKLSAGKVCVHVTVPQGATGVKVYCGTKLIKTFKANGTFKYSASKAGSKYYKVRAYVTEGGKNYYSGYTTGKKPSLNQRTWAGQGSYSSKNSFSYGTAHFLVSKVYYSGGKLKVTGYLYNSRIFTLKSVKVTCKVYAEGKTYNKTFIVKPKLGEYGRKKVTLTFAKGTAYDLRGSSWNTKCVGNWGWGYEY